MEKIVKNFPQYIITTCGAVSVGMCLGWTSTTQEEILYGDAYDFILTENKFSWIGSLLTLGAACISIPMEFLINAMGRKYSMILLVLPFTIGWALLIWAQNEAMMYIGRFILGIAAGGYYIVVPVYTTEISSEELRGTLGLVFQLMITFGILLVFTFGWILETYNTSLIAGAIPILLSLILLFMPQSPTYLVRKGKIEEAKKSIQRLRGKLYDATQELKKIQTERDEFAKKKLSFSDTIFKSIGRKALIIILGLMMFQQLSGICAIIFFTETIAFYAEIGLNSFFSTVLVGIILVITALISVFIVHRLPRRILLVISGIVMTICTALLGYYFYSIYNDKSVEGLEIIPLLSLCIFVMAYSLGYGPVPWILINEVFPTEVREEVFAMAGTFKWISAFFAIKSFVYASDSFEYMHSFWIFSAVTIIGCIFVVLVLPETKGKSLAENQKLFGIKLVESKSLSKIQIFLGKTNK